MKTSRSPRVRRMVKAVVLAALAIVWILAEPFPKGNTLLSLTEHHGVDTGDIPAIVLLLIAAWLALY